MSAHQTIEQDCIAAEKLRVILSNAALAIAALSFTHFPVRGYDQNDVLDTLRDMMPPHAGAVYARALELAECAAECAA